MFLNKSKIRELMNEKANGVYHEFARQMDVDVAQIHRILNTNSEAGARFLGRFKIYCDANNINFNDYIFLESPLHGGNNN